VTGWIAYVEKENFDDIIGNQFHDLQICGIVNIILYFNLVLKEPIRFRSIRILTERLLYFLCD
jgi:hypothetical protein